MTLTERLDRTPAPPKKLPRWIERMQRMGLPPKEMTKASAL